MFNCTDRYWAAPAREVEQAMTLATGLAANLRTSTTEAERQACALSRVTSVESASRNWPIAMHGDVAVIDVQGVIMGNAGILAMFGMVGNAEIAALVSLAAADDAVREIVMVYNTPGGAVAGLTDAADAIYRARSVKRVTAYVSGTAASAGYWLASQSDEIVLGRSGIVGSIGIFLMLEDSSEQFASEGRKVIPIRTSELKGAGEPGLEVTDEQIAEAQRIVDAMFRQFLADIKRSRNVSAAQLKEASGGGVFIGKDAIAAGLADRVGSFDDTIERVNKRRPKGRSGDRPNATRANLAMLSTLTDA